MAELPSPLSQLLLPTLGLVFALGYVCFRVLRFSSQNSNSERLALWQAHRDKLTRLPNVSLFRGRLEGFLDAMENSSGSTEVHAGAVLTIDLDGFGRLNDSMGYIVGDQVLRESGRRLKMAVRETDTLARLGGGRFGVLLEALSDSEELSQISSAIVTAMSEPFSVLDKEVTVTASVGVRVLSKALDQPTQKSPMSVGEILQQADLACAEAARSGGNDAVHYESAMNTRAQTLYELETALRSALIEDQFELYYQPLVDQFSDRVVSFEALLRWHHPTRGLVSPQDFIPIAEKTGLIVEIGYWIVQTAQRQLRTWAQTGHPDLRLSINISIRQLGDAADAEKLLQLLDSPETARLTLEITESLLVDDKELYREFLVKARRLGARIALDDFGTGYSSLSHLREFDFDVLKIDRSFVNALKPESTSQSADRRLIESIIALGRQLQLDVVAEGVEKASELKVLAELGCAQIQGYYFSPPMPANAAKHYLSQSPRHSEVQSDTAEEAGLPA